MPTMSENWRPAIAVQARRRPVQIILAGLMCLILGFGGGWLGAKTYNDNISAAPVSTSARAKYISSESNLISSIAKDVGKGVVSINVSSNVSSPDFFGLPQTSQQQSAGTGFIISNDGIIVTNRHVVGSDATNVNVTLADGTTFKNVKIIGATSQGNSLDIAFLKINDLNGKKLYPVTMGDSTKIQVGDKVVAIGNALGQFQNTVTSGIISGYGRSVVASDESSDVNASNLTDLFQTDAAINQGNSGGPLVDVNGQVIGINTAVAGNAQNIGFAIPINDVKGLINGVLKTGKLLQPYLGVRYVPLTDDLANQYNLNSKRGAYIPPSTSDQSVSIITGSPADKAGLQEKDIITKVDGTTIDEKTSLTSALSRYQVGDRVTLTVVRGKETKKISVVLGQVPQQ